MHDLIQPNAVQRSLATGAPPTPWMLRREDRDAMEAIEWYFARAIPNGPEGKPFIRESLGPGGPQLELIVPIISTRRPVAILGRIWEPASQALESVLAIFGAVEGRLAGVVAKTGFERASEPGNPEVTVFRNHRRFSRQRAS